MVLFRELVSISLSLQAAYCEFCCLEITQDYNRCAFSICITSISFSALTVLVGHQEEHSVAASPMVS